MASFAKYLFDSWRTLGPEVINLLKVRTGRFCSIQYKEINAYARELVPSRWPPEHWGNATVRDEIRRAIVDHFEPPSSDDPQTVSGIPITKAALARIEALSPGVVNRALCCPRAVDSDVAEELAARLLDQIDRDPMIWGRSDVERMLFENMMLLLDMWHFGHERAAIAERPELVARVHAGLSAAGYALRPCAVAIAEVNGGDVEFDDAGAIANVDELVERTVRKMPGRAILYAQMKLVHVGGCWDDWEEATGDRSRDLAQMRRILADIEIKHPVGRQISTRKDLRAAEARRDAQVRSATLV